MHIPDGSLDTPTCLATATVAAGAVGYSVWRLGQLMAGRSGAVTDASSANASTGRGIEARALLVRMGAVGAGVFVAQGIDFPIVGGTTGHVLGGALAGAVLGPWAGIVAMTLVLAIQCFALGDGGATTLGANILNMGVLGVALGHIATRLATRRGFGAVGQAASIGAAAFAYAALAAAACAAELAFGGGYDPSEVIPAMLAPHAILGIAEAAFTAAAVAWMLRESRVAWTRKEIQETSN